MTAGPFLLRNVEVAGQGGLDVRLEAGRIVEIGPGLAAHGATLDGRGGALIPGLADHHIHLLALAARSQSVELEGARDAAEVRVRIAAAAAARPPGAWIRALGYDEAMAGALTCVELDALAPRHPLRVQHRTGALWMLNGLALAQVCGPDDPAAVERDDRGQPTGRIWRGDAWLRTRLPRTPPDLGETGRRLASYGVTHLTDASVTTDATAAALLADAHRADALPQRLTLMSGGELAAPPDSAFTVGPVKILLDDDRLPHPEAIAARIRQARRWGRAVAVHCVTAAELAVALAGFGDAGAQAGDRIEHGGLIPAAAIAELKALRLSVVTQPAFIWQRGDRYAVQVEAGEQRDLYRCASLLAAGVPVAGSSDAPYATDDPWRGVAAAIDRRTRGGLTVAATEGVDAARALALYLDAPDGPGVTPRRVAVGAPADLCLLASPLREVLRAPGCEQVRATLIGGRIVHQATD